MQLQELQGAFADKGIEVVAISSNSKELAEKTVTEWGLEQLTIGYGLGMDDAARWGLFASAGIKDTEPTHFVEPAQFVVRPDGELYASIVQTMPFSRAPLEGLLSSLSWIIEKDYPARGETDPASVAGG